MELEEVIRKRRSIRRFKPDAFPDDLVNKALELATLAPNSSNTQTWDFHWVKSPEIKSKVVEACLNQSAARTASHLIVATANPKNWKRSHQPLVSWVKKVMAPAPVVLYYEKLIPWSSRSGIFNIFAPLKWLIFNIAGLFRPMTRGPITWSDLNEIAVKSCALACENFVLGITAQGGASCMMEGFDRNRLKKALGLSCSTSIVMVIGIGYEAEKGTWGPQFRLPMEQVVHYH